MEFVKCAANWLGKDIENNNNWVHYFSTNEVKEIKSALSVAESSISSLSQVTKDNFRLPQLSQVFEQIQIELEEGLGIKLLRGFPVSDFSEDQLRLVYWGIGLYLGTAVSQSKRNDYLGDVRDLGTGLDGPEFRGYTSNGELTYHVDAADITGLFCLKPAKEGGLSKIISSVAIHNEILKRNRDLLETLYQKYPWSMQGNELPGHSGFYTQPIFAIEKGYFACRYTRTHIRSAEMNPEIEDLSLKQTEALELIDEICRQPEFNLTMMFEPGDIQFLNNHLTMHTRTAFIDYAKESEKRHLLRLWLSMPNGRPLSEGFKPFFRDVSQGAVRGGFSGLGEPLYKTI